MLICSHRHLFSDFNTVISLPLIAEPKAQHIIQKQRDYICFCLTGSYNSKLSGKKQFSDLENGLKRKLVGDV